jgi:hypothetical protein
VARDHPFPAAGRPLAHGRIAALSAPCTRGQLHFSGYRSDSALLAVDKNKKIALVTPSETIMHQLAKRNIYGLTLLRCNRSIYQFLQGLSMRG